MSVRLLCLGAGLTLASAVQGAEPAPEPKEQLGDLGLSPTEEAAIAAYLGTLSDRQTRQRHRPPLSRLRGHRQRGGPGHR
jgi:hypothetical protein